MRFLAVIFVVAFCNGQGIEPEQKPLTPPIVKKPPPQELITLTPPPPVVMTPPPPPPETYVAYIPKVIRPGFPIVVSVTILQDQIYPVDVHVKLNTSDGEIDFTASKIISPMSTEKIVFADEIPLNYEGLKYFNMSIYGIDTVTNEEVFRNITSRLTFESKSFSILIQSDKAIYRPGQTIKFRAAITDSKLMPFNEEVEYSVLDPQNNVVLMNRTATPIQGFVGDEYKLPRKAAGIHRIKFKIHNFEESITADVYDYKLPKFSVSVAPQSFVHPRSDGLSGSVKGTYTFGQPVQGSAVVEVYRHGWCGEKIAITKEFPVFSGDEDFFFPMKQLRDVFGYTGGSERSVTVSATVTDSKSGESFTETKSVEMKRTHVKIEKLFTPTTIKPGLKYMAFIKVTQQDGMPLEEKDRNVLMEIRIEHHLPYNGKRWPSPIKSTLFRTIPENGIIEIEIQAMNNNFTRVEFEPEMPGVPKDWSAQWTAYRFKSPSETFIQVTSSDSTLDPGSVATVNVNSNIPLPSYKLDILSRGHLVDSAILTEPTYSFPVTHDMTPNVQIVASFVHPENGEIIADGLKLIVNNVLRNNVTISLSDEMVDAGNMVGITVNAHPGSRFGLLAVDQSVLLLNKGNDITKDRITKDINNYDPNNYYNQWWRYWWPTPSSGTDATEVFHRAGLEILTDAFLYSQRYVHVPFMSNRIMGGNQGASRLMAAAPAQMEMVFDDGNVQQTATATTTERTEFPETWIWEESETSTQDGKKVLQYKAPDTITSWELSSFAISDIVGLGVTSQNSKLTVFRNFFVQLNLPPKITRGEILIMKATVFNYFDEDVVADVEITVNEWMEIEEANPSVPLGTSRTITIPANDAVAVIFAIKFIKVGRAPIAVRATCARANDALKRQITVKPEGIMKSITESQLIIRNDANAAADVLSFAIETPEDIVEGSEYVNLYAYGDILGSTLGNLGNLLSMPGGCGEQNMLNFAPDVFITLYLMKANKLDDKTKNIAYSHIRSGYSNQLTYKRRDGSYSAFGASDRSGSTWLTAFVTKCFMFAALVNPDFVQNEVIVDSFKFIVKQQSEDGVFHEPGRVIHSSMQGGVNSNVTMTAYVLISMIENEFIYRPKTKDDKFMDDFDRSKKTAIAYLEKKSTGLSDKYAMALVTYALKLAKSKTANKLLKQLEKMVETDGANKYWTTQEKCIGYDCYHSQSSDIEMTSYILLTYALNGKSSLAGAFPIVRWLVSQRNSFGGYHSTQDTVIAIQALSQIASLMEKDEQDLSIADASNNEIFSITSENDIVLQTNEIKDFENDVEVSVTGEGFGILQLTTNYNVHTRETDDEAFKLDVTINEINRQKASLKICSRVATKDGKVLYTDVGMFLVTVALANGFTVDIDVAKATNPNAKLIEMDGTDVNLYYDTIGSEDQCFTLALERYVEIARMSSQVITTMDYYKPERVSYREYVIPSLATATVCDVCGSKCPGCAAPAWEEWQPWENYCGTNTQTRQCKDSNGDLSTLCSGEHTKSAYQTPFPCPSFTDGLYIDPNSALYREAMDTGGYITCKAPKGALPSQNIGGLPSTYLNGDEQLLVCDDDIFKKLISRDDGFTIAFMMFSKIKYGSEYTVLSVGSDTEQSRIKLTKPSKSNEMELTILFREFEYQVTGIQYDNNEWKHVAITWDPLVGARVYVMGVLTGSYKKTNTGRQPVVTTVDSTYNLIFGISHADQESIEKDFYRGLLNSLDVWNRALGENDIRNHQQYYNSFIGEKDPFLSLAQVRHIVPESISGCFKKGAQASELKARSKEVADWC